MARPVRLGNGKKYPMKEVSAGNEEAAVKRHGQRKGCPRLPFRFCFRRFFRRF